MDVVTYSTIRSDLFLDEIKNKNTIASLFKNEI